MKLTYLLPVLLLSSCASQIQNCEDITQVAEQLQACEILKKKMIAAKNYPVMRSELEQRYQHDCIENRYYRDDKQDAICGNKQQVNNVEKKLNSSN